MSAVALNPAARWGLHSDWAFAPAAQPAELRQDRRDFMAKAASSKHGVEGYGVLPESPGFKVGADGNEQGREDSDAMKRKKSPKVSLGDIAKAAGISRVAASYALRNRPGVSEATRQRVFQIAKRMGYVPDARITSWMAQVRETKAKDLLPIAWLNLHGSEKDTRHYGRHLSPHLEGARARALQLGYRIEEMWTRQPGMTMGRISEILYQRGIEGVVITDPARHIRLDWEHLAGVALEGNLLAPRLPRVMPDLLSNLLLAVRMVKRLGYRRIGFCFEETVDLDASQAVRSVAHYLSSTTSRSERVEPLFYPWGSEQETAIGAAQVPAWMKRQKPEVVIGRSNLLVNWAEEAGYRVPDDLGIVHIAKDDEVGDWAGICSHKREIGAAAVELVISRIQKREFGVPEVAADTLIRGSWSPGRTLVARDVRASRE